LAEVEELPTTIREWERAVRLNRNQRQSRAEQRMLGRNAACPGRNTQLRRGYGGDSYGEREEQITWRAGGPSTGGGYREEENIFSRC